MDRFSAASTWTDERWTPGRQPWLTRPDASEAYPLSLEEPMADLFAFAWRPDGAALVYLRPICRRVPSRARCLGLDLRFDHERGYNCRRAGLLVFPDQG